jgi:hypothetical protein
MNVVLFVSVTLHTQILKYSHLYYDFLADVVFVLRPPICSQDCDYLNQSHKTLHFSSFYVCLAKLFAEMGTGNA